MPQPYILRIHIWTAKEERVMNEVYRLDAVDRESIDTIIEILNLVMSEDIAFIRPQFLIGHIVNFRGDRSHDPEIMASTLHSPPQIRMWTGGRDGANNAIGSHHAHRDKLVRNETMSALQKAMATT